ncbi:MAG TPA: bifunctional sulfate adenylyltransferase/adenylylsulfate kinase [Gammaproteobacteria bacterium]|nr:bifunctional sulfate adenylyltransferase/adenylylsulfate kinase [Gammaproteobacteria bacterium]
MESRIISLDGRKKFTAHITAARIEDYKYIAHELPALTMTRRQLCDLEMILNGGFAPLSGFMSQADYENVLENMRLADGTLWPMPVMLDVEREFADSLELGQEIALRDAEGLLLAILKFEEKWDIDHKREAEKVFGTNDSSHPGVAYLFQQTKAVYISGKLLAVSMPHHYDFTHLRFTPAELKEIFSHRGWKKIVGFQTRNPMHRAHQELTRRACEQTGANLLLHPVVGMTKPGDIEYYTRVRCYEHVIKTYPENTAFLSLLPLAMRMGGPREAVWHAIIRKNYGCTHFIVGRDHAGPGKNKMGDNFYDPYAAQELALQCQKEIGIEIVPFQEMSYSHAHQKYFAQDEFPAGEKPATISGTEFRERLYTNQEIPEWFSYPAIIDELRKAHPPKHKQGFTVFLTGLPSSGKSTLANALSLKLRELTDRPITFLDGDVIRTHLSHGLGFSQEDRETNITRVGFVAKEITRHGGIVICALVAPFARARNIVREMISEAGGYIEAYVSTPLEVCEQRDRKGMYKKAREGVIRQFTGVSDTYEVPESPEIMIDTVNASPAEIIDSMIRQIQMLGYVQ